METLPPRVLQKLGAINYKQRRGASYVRAEGRARKVEAVEGSCRPLHHAPRHIHPPQSSPPHPPLALLPPSLQSPQVPVLILIPHVTLSTAPPQRHHPVLPNQRHTACHLPCSTRRNHRPEETATEAAAPPASSCTSSLSQSAYDTNSV